MAAECLRTPCETLIIDDDVATMAADTRAGARGVAGTIIIQKIIGAAAESGFDLSRLKALGESLRPRVKSIGVALGPCRLPATGAPSFHLETDEIEIGVGIHGEPGVRRGRFASADGLAGDMLSEILHQLPAFGSHDLVLLVNGFGGTPAIELYLMANAASRFLASQRHAVVRTVVGSFVTSLEMAGCSFTLAALDAEMLALWDAPAETAALRWG